MTRRRLAYVRRPYAERRRVDRTCPSRWYSLRCVTTMPHTVHTDGHAVVWGVRAR